MGNFPKKFLLFVFAFLLIDGILFFVWQKERHEQASSASVLQSQSDFPEISFFNTPGLTYKPVADFLENLAKTKGAEYAYAVLRVAPLTGIDLHLLGHVVGTELYAQRGIQGMYSCTQEFRNACSHSIVVGLFLEKGERALVDITDACKKAPGGSGAYAMCFHGLGHGVLAYFEYDLQTAVKTCMKAGLAEGNQCVGGAIMEIVGGGFHDTMAWEKQRKIYLKAGDPLYPCDSDLIPQSAKSFCYSYITPHLITKAGGSLQALDSASLTEAFTYCSVLPLEDSSRRSCYGGFGKDFVVVAKGRDIRHIDKMSDEELGKVYTWCLLADAEDGKKHCLITALNSLFWGGENDPKISVRFCEILKENVFQAECFHQLVSAAGYYLKGNADQFNTLCTLLPKEYYGECKNRISYGSGT